MASLSAEELQKMKVAELKKELKDRGLSVTGTKAELLERMLEAVNSSDINIADESLEEKIDLLVQDVLPKTESAPIPATKVAEPSVKDLAIENTKPANSAVAKNVVSLHGMSEAERLKARASKFGGAVSETAKKQMRAERFGLAAPGDNPMPTGGLNKISVTPPSTEDVDKLKKRAERFGTVVSDKLSKVEEEEKKRKRTERFGNSAAQAEVKKVKLTTAQNSDLEDKKRKRAERFGLT